MAQTSEGWVTARLRDCLIGIPQYGANASAIDYDPQLPRYIRITDITDSGTLSNNDLKSINERDAIGYILEPGDFIFARTGATVGKAYLHRDSSDRMAYAGYLIRFKIDKSKLMPEFLEQYTKTSVYWAWVRKTIHAGAQPNINANEYASMEIPLPPLNQQGKIVEMISIWDLTMEKIERLIRVKERQLKYLVNKIVSDKTHPRVFVREFTTESSIRNNDERCNRVLSVTNTNGFVLPEEQFERRVASEDLSNYKLVRKSQYAYNPSRINVGSIARLNDWPEGVLSPMYVVFSLDEGKINSDFFHDWLSSYEARERIKRSAQGSVRETVGFQSFGDIAIPLPSLNTQLKIAELLNTAKNEIDLLKKQLETLRKQKHGLMQKLLTGEWRVKAAMEEE